MARNKPDLKPPADLSALRAPGCGWKLCTNVLHNSRRPHLWDHHNKVKNLGAHEYYISAVAEHGWSRPAGLLLCRRKNQVAVKYALRKFAKPTEVAGFEPRLVEAPSKELEVWLPTVEQLEVELRKAEGEKAGGGDD